MWKWAREYTLADNFFMGAFGGSYLNHLWLVCACTPRDEHAPASARAQVDENGKLKRRPGSPASARDGDQLTFDGDVTPDGWSVNTTQPPYQPSGVPPAAGGDPRLTDPTKHTLPPQTTKTIGDTLSAKGVSWAWYAGGWNAALKDGMQPPDAKRTVVYNREKGSIVFQPHHQPFNYFARFAPGTADRERHLKDYTDLVAGIEKGELPQVAFYKPQGSLNEHPGYTDVLSGDTAHGRADREDQGQPAVVVDARHRHLRRERRLLGPRARRRRAIAGARARAFPRSSSRRSRSAAYVDHTAYDTTSIIKFITLRFGLEPLPGVRAGAGDLTAALDF